MALANIRIKDFKNYGWPISRGCHKLGRVFKIYILGRRRCIQDNSHGYKQWKIAQTVAEFDARNLAYQWYNGFE